jgi:hypothetical protein
MKRLAVILFFLQLIPIILILAGELVLDEKYNSYSLIAGFLSELVIVIWFTKSVNKIKQQYQEQKDIDDILNG